MAQLVVQAWLACKAAGCGWPTLAGSLAGAALCSQWLHSYPDIPPPAPTLQVCSPIELAIVFVLVGLKLGFLASFAGISTLLLLIPAQVLHPGVS